jgi:hypothetical protein
MRVGVSLSLSEVTVGPAGDPPANTVAPSISGTPTEGQILTASTGTWTGSPSAYAYQWKRNGVAIAGSINSTRLLTAADVGASITVTVTASNGGGSAQATSGGVGPVASASPGVPVNTSPPTSAGITTVGQVLTVTPGTWTGATSLAYQWRADGINIGGATATTYLLTAGEAGKTVTCRELATNAGGTAAAISNGLGPVAAQLAISGTPPAIGTVGAAYSFTPTLSGGRAAYSVALHSGTLPAGLSLNTSTGAITGTPTTPGAWSGIVLRLTDADGLTADLASFAIVVSAALTITGSPATTTGLGAPYSFTPALGGGHTPYAVTLQAGTLPAGLSLNSSTGAITGTPTAAGTAAGLVLRVTDADGRTADLASFSLTVSQLVTAVEVLGDISIAITSPSSQSVPMQTNGTGFRVATSGSALVSAIDKSKITVSVTDLGHDTSGAQVAQSRTIGIRDVLWKPYGENTAAYQPTLGEFYFHLDDFIYNQDSTWKTTIVSVDFASGWLSGAVAEGFLGTVTRNDTLTYPIDTFKAITAPWQRVATGGTLPVEIEVIAAYARAKSMVACVEAWLVDSGSQVGTLARTSTFARSPSTPNDATTKGYPVPTYALNVSPAGLTGGKVYLKYRKKPWIGPPVDSDAYVGADAFPTHNPAQSVPFCYDTDSSHAPLYGVLSNEQASAPSGKTLIATNTSVTTVDVSGLSTTMAGAIASGKVYADLGTLATAVRRVNKNAGPFTIADPVTGAASFSYARTTTHDDLSGGVAVCRPVSGSALGSDTGAYSMWQALGSQTSYPPGLTAFEIRSESGVISDDVRWRGQHSDGSNLSFANRQLPSRVRLRGLQLDSTGITTASQNIVFQGGENSTTAKTEAAAIYSEEVDCIVRNSTSVSISTSVAYWQRGFSWDVRSENHNDTGTGIAQGPGVYPAGLVSSIGCYYNNDGASMVTVSEAPWLFGAKLRNIGLAPPAENGRNRPRVKGAQRFNVEVHVTAATITTSPFSACNSYPTVGGEGICGIHIWAENVTTSNWTVAISNDGVKHAIDTLTLYHLGVAVRQATSADFGRLNIGYLEQGWIRIDKRIMASYIAARQWNEKGDSMIAPETAASTGVAANNPTTAAIIQGDIVTNGGVGYQAKIDVPIGTSLTNTTYLYNGGSSTVAFGGQPLRQGNTNFRYSTRCIGNVAPSPTAQVGDTAPGPGNSWYGFKWDATSKSNATIANYYNNLAGDDYTPKVGGDLVNRVPAGRAVVPFDLVGRVLNDDGTDAAGALQLSTRSLAA